MFSSSQTIVLEGGGGGREKGLSVFKGSQNADNQ